MIREEDKDAVVCRIIEKLQNSSLFLEMKADLQVNINLTCRLISTFIFFSEGTVTNPAF